MRNDDLEELLQAGLKSYGDAEPLRGIEERVLRRVQEKRVRIKWLWFRWAGAIACACLLLAVVSVSVRRWPVHKQDANGVQSTTANMGQNRSPLSDMKTPNVATHSVLRPAAVHARGDTSLVTKRSETKPEKLPKLKVFPTPHALTAEERALVKLVNENPKVASQLVDAERRMDEPIQIAGIHIEPLKIDGSH